MREAVHGERLVVYVLKACRAAPYDDVVRYPRLSGVLGYDCALAPHRTSRSFDSSVTVPYDFRLSLRNLMTGLISLACMSSG